MNSQYIEREAILRAKQVENSCHRWWAESLIHHINSYLTRRCETLSTIPVKSNLLYVILSTLSLALLNTR